VATAGLTATEITVTLRGTHAEIRKSATAYTQANYNEDISSIRDAKNSREFNNSREASNSLEGPNYNMATFIPGMSETVGNSTSSGKPTTPGKQGQH
jgi:hypothetical protein